MHKLFIEELQTLRVSPKVLRLFEVILERNYKSAIKDKAKDIEKLEERIKGLKKNAENIEKSLIEFRSHERLKQSMLKQYDELHEQILDLERKESKAKDGIENYEPLFKECKANLENPCETWESLDIKGKTRYQKWLFPEGITYDYKSGLRTKSICRTYSLFQAFGDDVSQKIGAARLELTTSRSQSERSSQLNYAPINLKTA